MSKVQQIQEGESSIGRFGPAVIGQEQYDREQAMLQEMGTGHTKFGPGVLSSEPIRTGYEERRRAAVAAKEAPPPPELPEGYKVTSAGGGYYVVEGPDGVLPGPYGPKKDKFKGRDAARAAAFKHAALEPALDVEPEIAHEILHEGSGDIGELTDEAIDALIAEATGEDAFISLPDLEELAGDNPATILRLYANERSRPDGPRREAIEKLLEAHQQAGDPDPAMLRSMELSLAQLPVLSTETTT